MLKKYKTKKENTYNEKLFRKKVDLIGNVEKSSFFAEKRDVSIDSSSDKNGYNQYNSGFEEYVKEKLEQLEMVQKKIEKAQKNINQMTKVNKDEFIVLVPGLCVEPENINDQWCLFWNDVGHITKKKEGNKTYIYIFLFRGEEVGKKKITDVYNVTCASLWVNGFALASNPYEQHASLKNNSVLCFHNLKDNIVWEKFLPTDEYIKGVANGNNFVAIVTSNNFLRIYSLYGYIINTILLKGIPVAICAYDNLLFIITCSFIYEDVDHYNINNTYNCTLYKIYENFNNLKLNKYNTYNIAILHDGILSLPSCCCLVWVNMSNFGTPYIRDSSNFIYGLYPLFKNSTTNNSSFNGDIIYDWVPVFNLNELNSSERKKWNANTKVNDIEKDYVNNEVSTYTTDTTKLEQKFMKKNKGKENERHINVEQEDMKQDEEAGSNYYPLYFDNEQQMSVIKLNKDEKEPCSNKIESCLGYNVEKKFIRMSECNLIKYDKYAHILQKNPNLNLDDSRKSDAAFLSWEQYDEMRYRTDLTCKQLFANIFYDYLNDGKNKSANEKLKSLNKLYDKWTMRMFTFLKKERKKQKLAVKIAGSFKNVKNIMSALRSVEDEHGTLYSEISEEFVKRQIIDETSKSVAKQLGSCAEEDYYYDYKDDEQKRKDIYKKCYKKNQHMIEQEDHNNIFLTHRGNNESFINALKKQSEIPEKKDRKFLDKFFVGITKNENVDTLFSSDKASTDIPPIDKKNDTETKIDSYLNVDNANNKGNIDSRKRKSVEHFFRITQE